MDRYLFSENDSRGEEIYKQLNINPQINKDYFLEDKREENLEDFFESADIPLAQNSKQVKLKLLKNLRKHKLDIFSYFNIIESFFNKYYYGIELTKEEERKLGKYFD